MAVTAALPQCQGSTWTMTGCIRGSACLHIPVLLPPLRVTPILIRITILTTCGLVMIPSIDSPHEITHLPPGGIPMVPHFEAIPMIILLAVCLPLKEAGVVDLLPLLRLPAREEDQSNVSVKKVCLIWKSLLSIGHRGERKMCLHFGDDVIYHSGKKNSHSCFCQVFK